VDKKVKVFCGGYEVTSEPDERLPLVLNTTGPQKNVNCQIKNVCESLKTNIPDLLLDLVEIASYVYTADQAVSRGPNTDPGVGAQWRRHFLFYIAVRRPDIWSSEPIVKCLQDALQTVSDDFYQFEFCKLTLTQSIYIEQYFDFGIKSDPFFNADEVLLFSGGMDSLAGAVQEIVVNGRRTVLVSHVPSSKVGSVQNKLAKGLTRFAQKNAFIYSPFTINKNSRLTKEYTQTTRSFLFVSLAATLAKMFNVNTIKIHENGITSFNLPIAEQLISTRASRTTHPGVLNNYTNFFSQLFGHEFKVENPFIWKTKAELYNLVGDAGCKKLISQTKSCTHTQDSAFLFSHCGTCLQCVNRRIAALASKYSESDPADMYRIDFISGALEAGDQQTLVESYIKTYLEINEITDNEFFSRFGEAARVLRWMNMPASVAAEEIYDLHKRHAGEVCKILDDSLSKHSQAIRKKALPDTCLLVQYLSDRVPRKPILEDVKQPTFIKTGEIWLINFDSETCRMKNKDGLHYIHELLLKPGYSIDCSDLYMDLKGKQEPYSESEFQKYSDEQMKNIGMSRSKGAVRWKMLDEKTIKRIKECISDLKEQLKIETDFEAKAELESRLEILQKRLKQSTTPFGKSKASANYQDTTRVAVTRAIKRAVSDIEKHHKPLAIHLRRSIITGSHLCYDPEKKINWQL